MKPIKAKDLLELDKRLQVVKLQSYPIPEQGEQCMGALCFVCVGYDDTNNWYKIRTPFCSKWGDNGFFYVPYDVMEGTASMEGSTVVSPQQCIYEKDYCFDFYLLK